ncbi:MAG: 2,3-diaminopropionate biosynthesis protein SbnA [Bacteroidota bacterium]
MFQGQFLDKVGNTPLVDLSINSLPNVNIKAKLELYNPTRSVKDRAAYFIIKRLLESGQINQQTTLIESSSGNFGVALAAYCRRNQLRFICVVDPYITSFNENLLKSYQAEIIKVQEPDESGGYLKSRIKKVKELKAQISNSYWVNQYGNPLNASAYYHTLGEEICTAMDQLDYVFIGVSSGGTITGTSQRLKKHFPNIKVIAVDVEGSVIFGHPPRKRQIPGIGSSMVPDILQSAKIDEVELVNERTTIDMCHELLNNHYLFVGGSSGSVFGAIHQYFQRQAPTKETQVLAIFADDGGKYLSTIFDQTWCDQLLRSVPKKPKAKLIGAS